MAWCRLATNNCLDQRGPNPSLRINAGRIRLLWGESTGDRWILLTNDKRRGKCVHLMASSWNSLSVMDLPRLSDVQHGNIFRITGPFLRESTGHRWISWQRPVTRSFDVCCNLRLNKRLSKQRRRRWFEAPSLSLWRYCNEWQARLTMFHWPFNDFINSLHDSYAITCIRNCQLNFGKYRHISSVNTHPRSERNFCLRSWHLR